MKTEYLGKFKTRIELNTNEDDVITILSNEEDLGEIYCYDDFMRHSEIIEGIGEIHAVCGETNNSSIVLQFDEDDSECVKLWRIW